VARPVRSIPLEVPGVLAGRGGLFEWGVGSTEGKRRSPRNSAQTLCTERQLAIRGTTARLSSRSQANYGAQGKRHRAATRRAPRPPLRGPRHPRGGRRRAGNPPRGGACTRRPFLLWICSVLASMSQAETPYGVQRLETSDVEGDAELLRMTFELVLLGGLPRRRGEWCSESVNARAGGVPERLSRPTRRSRRGPDRLGHGS